MIDIEYYEMISITRRKDEAKQYVDRILYSIIHTMNDLKCIMKFNFCNEIILLAFLIKFRTYIFQKLNNNEYLIYTPEID